MIAPNRQRLRLRYRKDDVLMYIGHKDLLRFMMKMLRKTQFPFATSGMFSPKPRVTFGPALPLGVQADNELLDIELADELRWDADEINAAREAFAVAAAPRDFVRDLTELPLDTPPIAKQAQGARYLLDLGTAPQELLALIEQTDLHVTGRDGKVKDLRQGIQQSYAADDNVHLEGGVAGAGNLNIVQIAGCLERQSGLSVQRMLRLCLLDAAGTEL